MAEEKETWMVRGKEVPRPTADETVEILETKNIPRNLDPELLDMMWEGELQRAGIYGYIPMKVSKYGHDIGHRDAYADATVRYNPLEVVFHPFLLYTGEDYVRKVMRHEISHIKAEAKRNKPLKEALGL